MLYYNPPYSHPDPGRRNYNYNDNGAAYWPFKLFLFTSKLEVKNTKKLKHPIRSMQYFHS